MCSAVSTTVAQEGATASAKSVPAAFELGKRLAEAAKGLQLAGIVFDRNGFRYHGRVKAVADGAREGGLEF
jgi:large subunit ribosomal protein L18